MKYLLCTLLFCTALRGAEDPEMEMLPGGVHTYVWERSRDGEFDHLELRLVIPAGFLHEKGNEIGVTYALRELLENSNPETEGHTRLIANLSSSLRLDATIFSASLPYQEIDRLPAILSLFADWVWNWTPQGGPREVLPWPDHCSMEQLAVAAYAGRRDLGWPSAMPSDTALTNFYNRTYRALPIGVVVVGDIDPPQIHNLIADAFANSPSGNLGPLPDAPLAAKWPTQVDFSVEDDPEGPGDPSLEIQLFLPVAPAAYCPRRSIAREIVCSYLRARLGRGFRQEMIDNRTCSFLTLAFTARPSQLLPVLGEIDAEVRQIAEEGVSQEMIDAICKPIQAEMTRVHEREFSAKTLADSCADHFRGIDLLYVPDSALAIERAFATITLEEVAQYAASIKPLASGLITVRGKGPPEMRQLKTELEEIFHE